MAGVFGSWLLTHYRRKRINHRFRRSSLTKPHQKFTSVHPSDLPLARFARMVRVCLGLHPSAVARFVTWRLRGSGTGLDTIQSRDNESRLLNLVQSRVATKTHRCVGPEQIAHSTFVTSVEKTEERKANTAAASGR